MNDFSQQNDNEIRKAEKKETRASRLNSSTISPGYEEEMRIERTFAVAGKTLRNSLGGRTTSSLFLPSP
jgi:hypothetical protein